MIILALRTDKPEAEISLYEDHKQLVRESWEAHRRLAETLHTKIQTMLDSAGKSWKDIGGIVVYQGPGSFTGLRIGISVANALAYSNDVPVTGNTSEKWLDSGIDELLAGRGDRTVVPEYGSEAHTTSPKK